jgi:hypothetical protein
MNLCIPFSKIFKIENPPSILKKEVDLNKEYKEEKEMKNLLPSKSIEKKKKCQRIIFIKLTYENEWTELYVKN